MFLKKMKLNRTSVLLLIFCVFVILVNATLGIFLTAQSANSMKVLIQNRMLDISNTAAAMLDGDVLGSIQAEDENTSEYQEVLRTLTYYQDNIDLKYIYCIRDMGNKEFVFTIDPTVEDPGQFGEPIVYTDALYTASLGTPAVDSEPYTDRWGRFYSAYSPVFDSSGKVSGIVAVDFAADWYDEQISHQVRTTLIISIMSLFFGTIIVLYIATMFRQRFRQLFGELNNLSDGIETLAHEITAGSGKDLSDELAYADDKECTGQVDEIGAMSAKIHSLRDYMSRQISYVRSAAYKDGLTGLENRTSYFEYIEQLDALVEKGTAEFAVAMFDINGLKEINDNKGHEQGDKAIIKAADVLRRTFLEGHARIFRIGGDEFVVILNMTEEELSAIIDGFDELLKESGSDDMEINISKGFAVFKKDSDKTYRDAFIRADRAMYADKKAFYKNHADRRRS
ncbi:MAG: diguanylate cyclase [Lachnospiraceae bacterium]|nr:diguanylate cyclase [Lachnospiraceae bacterium]